MSTRPLLLQLALLTLPPALAVAVAILLPRAPQPPQPSLAAFQQVRTGVTRDEVIAILGQPYTGYVPGGAAICGPGTERWECEAAELLVVFGPDGRAVYRSAHRLTPRPTIRPDLVKQLRAWLGV